MIHESHRRRHPETEEVKDDEEDGCRFFGGKTASHRASPCPLPLIHKMMSVAAMATKSDMFRR